MKLGENISNTKQKLYDGTDKDLHLKRFQLDLKGYNIDFTTPQLERNELEDLMLPASAMELIVKEAHLKVEQILVTIYKSEEGLRLYYLIKDRTLYLFSLGEFQPSRHKLIFEGAWSLIES